jgi:hypothetical protein
MGVISLTDFISKAKEEGCEVIKKNKESFIGNPPATNYPHIHVWRDGTIALSAGSKQNGKIGRDEEIDIDELMIQNDRYGRNVTGGLKETISWVMRSDS